ncbi:MAG: twin-arginine translocation pathway signal, partial [Bacteroidota bacterium]
MNRRSFLKSSTLASTAMLTPLFLQGMQFPGATGSRNGKILIVLQLSGGNDGLNTIIPYGNDIYYQQRPRLGIQATEVLKLNDMQGLHPALAPLRQLFDEGSLSIINSVGYPNPDRSHFRSMDIWQTGSSSSENWSTGWIGRYLDHHCSGKPPYHALEVDDGLSLALKGAKMNGFAMSNAQRLKQAVNNRYLKSLDRAHAQEAGGNLGYLYKTLTQTQDA